jgi:phosphonate transport system substrate-binding protein
MRVLFGTAIIALGLALSSCSTPEVGATSGDGRPRVLRYCFTSNAESPEAADHRLELTQRYLERELHVKVEVIRTTAYGAVIEAFRANKIDVASISPFSYVLASEKTPIEAIVMRGKKGGEPGEYTGVLAVPGNSPIQSVEDLKKHSKELTISFVDPASASGFLVQNAFLQSQGIEPERDFKKVVFAMGHPASLLSLKAGKVDVAATMQRLITRYEDTGKIAKGDVRILWVSPDIPNQPIAVRKDLPQSFKEEIRAAFIHMAEKDPEVWKNQSSAALPAPADQVYVAANDAMFDGLRQMARGAKNLNLLEH